jgi:DNA-binding winged helix-turn-helix (wHTH) protein
VQPSLPSPAMVQFGDYSMDVRAGELYRKGRKLKLQEQPFQILALLVAQRGQLVTRDELREKLWSQDTFVDFDHSLNTAVKKLRQALNDEADKPRFIETIPRKGYRFIGPAVETPQGAGKSDSAPAQAPETAAPGLVGRVFVLRGQSHRKSECIPVDEAFLKEKEKLEAAQDDLGLALLSAAEKLLVVEHGTRVKVLQVLPESGHCEIRILEGEHTAKSAVVARDCLSEAV